MLGSPLVLDRYQASLHHRRLSPTTIRLRMFYVTKFAQQYDVETATVDDMTEYVNSNPKWSDNTRQSAVASIRSFYKWAHKAGMFDTYRAEDLDRVRVRRRRGRIADDEVILRALDHADAMHTAMILLGAECGLRLSEIATLHRSCRDGDWLTIVGKGDEERIVHMREELAAALDELEQTKMRNGYYFPGRTRPHMHQSTVWLHIKQAVGVNPHALRHRAGTTVYRKTGNDIIVAQEFLGHSSVKTTQVYIHIGREHLMQASAASRMAALRHRESDEDRPIAA